MNSIERLEIDLRALIQGEFSSLIISFNDEHAPNYDTAEEWGEYHDLRDWVSEEEREKAIATNSVWTCQWYPDTPVGFYLLRASSLPALIAALRAWEARQS